MKFKSVGIISLGAYVPENIMTNFDFEKIIDTTDEWIRTRTGIEERRFCSPEQATSDLCIEAAKKALANANLTPEDIDMVIVATCTPDYQLPSTACIVQKKLGAVNAAAYDLNAACSGWIYGLTMATGLIKADMYKKVLVIGAEALSRSLDMQDRNTCILFGDGATAAILSEVEDGYGILSTHLGADGDLNGSLIVPAGGSRTPTSEETIEERGQYIKMKGQEVFKFAVNALPNAASCAIEKAGLKATDIDIFIPHQANSRIIETAAKRLEVPIDKFYMNMKNYGNTSAASIGLALNEAHEKGLIKKGDLVAMVGFGAGLTYAATVIKWSY
ncbi:MAG: ketoacyl-ACP synthase III [Fusobacteriaceae bacterium]|nr:ketoacyl-ACP synthase III [Fusobacteriaceae bacterium]